MHWKGCGDFDYVPVNLLEGKQRDPEFLALNQSGLVPLLVLDDGRTMSQSVAMMEYLEETIPTNPLYPPDPYLKAVVRQAVLMIAADCQPLQNLNVIRAFGDQGPLWAHQVIERALLAYQSAIVDRFGGLFSVGDAVTMADVVLVPQLYNARRFNVDMGKLEKLVRIEERLMQLEPFQRAAPDRQPDCPQSPK